MYNVLRRGGRIKECGFSRIENQNKGDLETLEDDEREVLCLLSTSRDKFCLLVSFAHSDILQVHANFITPSESGHFW